MSGWSLTGEFTTASDPSPPSGGTIVTRTISWSSPSTYADGTPIPPASAARIIIHVYKDGVETYVTLQGVTEWPIEVVPGETNVWELTAELDGQVSARSAPFSYTEPFQVPMSPTNLAIR